VICLASHNDRVGLILSCLCTVIAFAGDALVCVFPAGEITSSNSESCFKRSLEEACAQALQCAYELRTHKMHSLSAHFAVSCGPIQFALLGGVNDEWTYLMNGPCISELTTCIDNAPPQSVACTQTCLESAQAAQPLINASKVGEGAAYLITDFHQVSRTSVRFLQARNSGSDTTTASGKTASSPDKMANVSQRIAGLSSKSSHNLLVVSVPSTSTVNNNMNSNSSLGTPNSHASLNLDHPLGGHFSRSPSADAAAAAESKLNLPSANSDSTDSNNPNGAVSPEESKRYVEKMVKKASFFVPKPVLSSLGAGSLKSIAELRTITTMFVNLDSYSLKDNMDPLSLQPFFVLLQDILAKSGGFLRQFLIDDKGCVAIAMWGVPNYNHTDNSYRGVYCAWNLHTRVSELNHRVSIGLTVGPAYCGIVGSTLRRDYAGIGDKVNIAARLMAKAKGKVLVDPDVYLALDSIEKRMLIPYQELQLKGMKAPVTPYMFHEDADLSEFRDQDADHHSNTIIRQEVMKKLLNVLDQSVQGTPFLSRLKMDPANGRNSDLKSAILIDTNAANIVNFSDLSHDDTSGAKSGDKFDVNNLLATEALNSGGGPNTSRRTSVLRGTTNRIGSFFGMNTNTDDTPTAAPTAETPPSNSTARDALTSRKRSVLSLNTENVSEKKSERRGSMLGRMLNAGPDEPIEPQITPKGSAGGKFASSKYMLTGGKTASSANGFASVKQAPLINTENNAAVILYGVSGTGKSTALQFFKLSALRRRLRYVSVCCRQDEEFVPFSAIRKIFWELAGRARHNTNLLKKQLLTDLLNQTKTEEDAKFVAGEDSMAVFTELLMEKEKNAEDDILNAQDKEDENLDRKLESSVQTSARASMRVANMSLHAIADYEDEDMDATADPGTTGRKQSQDFEEASPGGNALSSGLTRSVSGARSSRREKNTVSALAKADPEQTNYLFALMLELMLSNFPAPTVLAIEDAQYIDEQSLLLLSLIQLHRMKIVILMSLLQQNSKAGIAGSQSPDSPNGKLVGESTAPTTPLSASLISSQSLDARDDFRSSGSAAMELHVATKTLQLARDRSGKGLNIKSSGGNKAGQAVFGSPSYMSILANPSTITIEMKPLTLNEINVVLRQIFNSKITAVPMIMQQHSQDFDKDGKGNSTERRRSLGMNKIEEKSEENSRVDASASQASSADSNAGTRRNSGEMSARKEGSGDNSGGSPAANAESSGSPNSYESIPPHLVKKVYEMTSGNAIWVKVIGRFIKEYGVKDFVRTTERGSAADCLKNLIIVRLEKLSLEQQQVLKHASVIGLEFSARSLAAVVPEQALPRLIKTIAVLCELGFIQCVQETPLPVYAFQHKLTRDTVYGILPHR
jgi:class 3 adenylate cyclase